MLAERKALLFLRCVGGEVNGVGRVRELREKLNQKWDRSNQLGGLVQVPGTGQIVAQACASGSFCTRNASMRGREA